MFAPGTVILALKVAVAAVTALLATSLVALAVGKPKWHGRLNHVFFVLTLTVVLGFEVIIRFINPHLTAGFSDEQREALSVHLTFALPAAVMLPAMLYTGRRRLLKFHVPFAVVFLILWTGTFVTGVFFLPHTFEPAP
jgi:hypothetical protein